MKMLVVFQFVIFALFAQCDGTTSGVLNGRSVNTSTQNSGPQSDLNPAKDQQSEMNMPEIFNYSGHEGDIKYRIRGSILNKGVHERISYANDNLVIEYTLENTGTDDYLVFNEGHSNNPDRSIVYVDAVSAHAVELSQKKFTEPTDRPCPARYVPITPRASWLKGGSAISKKIYLEFPIKQNTPFDDCGLDFRIPKTLDNIKFCLGYAKADPNKVDVNESGSIEDLSKVPEQKLICTGTFSLDEI